MERFPDDFMFRLTKKEYEDLRYHFGTSRWGGRRYLPYAFTEQGVACSPACCTASVPEPRLCMALRGEIVEKRCEKDAWSREGRRRTPAVR